MAQLDRTQLKALFENGDIPTEENFADLIDSLALKSEVGNDIFSTSTRTYDLIKSEHNKLLPYLCFNNMYTPGVRGVLGACGAIPSNDTEYKNNNYNNILNFRIGTGAWDKIKGSSVFGPDNTQIDTNYELDYTYTDLIESRNKYEDDNGNIVYINQHIPTLEYLMPIIANGFNPLLFIDHYNFYEPPYVSNNSIIPTPNSSYCITAKNFNRPISITKLYIEAYGYADSGYYSNLPIAIIDFNYYISAIPSDITIDSRCFTIDIPVSSGFAESVGNSVTSYEFSIYMEGVTLDDNTEFDLSDIWLFDSYEVPENWYNGSSDMDISNILNNKI